MINRVYDEINQLANQDFLEIFGGFHAQPEDNTPRDTKTLLMFGPKEPGFWPYFVKQPEYRSGQANALDRWSKRVIDNLADQFAGLPLYPFGGPPYHPFMSWAIQTKRSWHSPIQFLVHDTAGLMVSFRGVLCFNYHINLPQPPTTSPCTNCADKPCKTMCPIKVLTPTHYDASGCRSYILTDTGQDCLNQGCQVRRVCPVSQQYGRDPQQSRFHQLAFAQAN